MASVDQFGVGHKENRVHLNRELWVSHRDNRCRLRMTTQGGEERYSGVDVRQWNERADQQGLRGGCQRARNRQALPLIGIEHCAGGTERLVQSEA